MDVVRSPWRSAYVTRSSNDEGCVFCRAVANASAPDSLVVHEGDLSFVVMNLYPYNAGHVMVVPRRHLGSLQEATADELADLMRLATRLERVLAEVYRPDGINVGMNLGRPAGAGILGHIHLHVVPRWTGDTNFMTVVGETRVIPEDPVEACRRLRPHFA
jgi:ATP adenylyltransferase